MNLKTISTTLALLGTGSLGLTACDDKKEAPAKEVDKAKPDTNANAEKAKTAEEDKGDDKSHAKGEMSCGEGACGEGACGGAKKAVHAEGDEDAAKDAPAEDAPAEDAVEDKS